MKLSLFSVSYAGLWGQRALDLPAFIAKASSLGYGAVMLMGKRPHLAPLDATAEQLASIKSALERHGIECAVVAGYTDLAGGAPTCGLAAEVPYLEMQIAYVESLARIAAELGAPVVRIFTAYEAEGQSPQAIWQRVVVGLREICDRAAARGVTIAVQNHHDLGVHTDVLLELLGEVDRPNCRAGFDAWSPALRGEQLYDAARRMAPHTAITTNADYVRLPRFRYRPEVVNYERALPDMVRAVKFGEGFIDYPAFFQGLREGGFDGIASYEICCPIRGGGTEENLDACAAQYVRWMRRHVVNG